MVSIRTQAYELEFHIYMRMDAQFGLVLHHIQYDHYDENHEMLITVTNPEVFYQIELDSIVLLSQKTKIYLLNLNINCWIITRKI